MGKARIIEKISRFISAKYMRNCFIVVLFYCSHGARRLAHGEFVTWRKFKGWRWGGLTCAYFSKAQVAFALFPTRHTCASWGCLNYDF
jgi:hypothetical protein